MISCEVFLFSLVILGEMKILQINILINTSCFNKLRYNYDYDIGYK